MSFAILQSSRNTSAETWHGTASSRRTHPGGDGITAARETLGAPSGSSAHISQAEVPKPYFSHDALIMVEQETQLLLDEAHQALEHATHHPEDRNTLNEDLLGRFHQAYGALTLVGLPALGQLALELEHALRDLMTAQCPPLAGTVAEEGFALLRQEVQDAVRSSSYEEHGLAFLPIFRQIRQARGAREQSGVELFYPVLAPRLPRHLTATLLSATVLAETLKSARACFEAGLFHWMRKEQKEAPAQMVQALLTIARTQNNDVMRGFWWAAAAVADGCADDLSELALEPRFLLLQANLAIKQTLESKQTRPDRELYRRLLFAVLQMNTRSAHCAAVREGFDLDRYLTPARHDDEESRARTRIAADLHQQLQKIKEGWSRFELGNTEQSKVLQQQMLPLARQVGKLEIPGLEDVVSALTDVIRAHKTVPLPERAMHVALGLQVVDNLLMVYPEPCLEFPRQSKYLVDLLHLRKPYPVPLGNSVLAQREEMQLMQQLSHELLVNLNQVERIIDAYLRNPDDKDELRDTQALIRQNRGALLLLSDHAAIPLLDECSELIEQMRQGRELSQRQLQIFAEMLATLSFYFDALRRSEVDRDALLQPWRIRLGLDKKTSHSADLVQIDLTGATPDVPLPESTEGVQTTGQRAEIHLIDMQEKGSPPESADAPVKAALHIGPTGVNTPEILKATPGPAPVSTPPATTPAIELDEMLLVYIQEAVSVLANLQQAAQQLDDDPANREALTQVRRGFHTLKGSGRMVGQNDLAEVAWELEQTLNFWLDVELEATGALLVLVKSAIRSFAKWVETLQQTGQVAVETPNRLAESAQELRRSKQDALKALLEEAEAAEVEAIEVIEEMTAEEEAFSRDTDIHEPVAHAGRERLEIDAQMFEEDPAAGRPSTVLPSPQRPPPPREPKRVQPAAPPHLTPLQLPGQTMEPSLLVAQALPWPGPLPTHQQQPDKGTALPASTPLANFDPIRPGQRSLTEFPAAALQPTPAAEILATESPLPMLDPILPADVDAQAMDAAAPVREKETAMPVWLGNRQFSKHRLDKFLEEGLEHFMTLNQGLLQYQRSRSLPAPMIISAHTLGGIAATISLQHLSEIGYGIEQALTACQTRHLANRRWQPDVADFQLLAQAVQAVGITLQRIGQNRLPLIYEGLPLCLRQLAERIARKEVKSATPLVPARIVPPQRLVATTAPAPAGRPPVGRGFPLRSQVPETGRTPHAERAFYEKPSQSKSENIAWVKRLLRVQAEQPGGSTPSYSVRREALPTPQPDARPADFPQPPPQSQAARHWEPRADSPPPQAQRVDSRPAPTQDAAIPARTEPPPSPQVQDIPSPQPLGEDQAQALPPAFQKKDGTWIPQATPSFDQATPSLDIALTLTQRIAQLEVQDELDEYLLPIFLDDADDLIPQAQTYLDRVSEKLIDEPVDQAYTEAELADFDAETLSPLKHTLHTLKGSARMAGAMRLGTAVHQLESHLIEKPFTRAKLEPELTARRELMMELYWRLLDGDPPEEDEPEGAPATKPAAPPPPAIRVTEATGPHPRQDSASKDWAREAAVEAKTTKGVPPTQEDHAETRAASALPVPQAEPGKYTRRETPLEPARQPSAWGTTTLVPARDEARNNIRVQARLIDDLVNRAGEVNIAHNHIATELHAMRQSLNTLGSSVGKLRDQVREVEVQAETRITAQAGPSREEALHREAAFDPLEFDRFTRLQELTRYMTENADDISQMQSQIRKNMNEVALTLQQQLRQIRDMQQGLLQARMMPLSTLSDRLYQVVRQTAKQTCKKVNLDLRGGQVELDRTMLDKMVSPIEHMLRNAVDHGIEMPEARLQAGKPECGEVVLAAQQVGNELRLVLSDDGTGLDLDRLREKGLESGLLHPDQNYSDDRLAFLIFETGISTAREVTQISGRGVGMGVAESELRQLGGQIEVHTVRGQGTTFTMRLPLTLAITQALLMQEDKAVYAIPTTMVNQVQELTPAKLEELYRCGMVEVGGRPYAVHYLTHLLGERDVQPRAQSHNTVLLLHSSTQNIALHVTRLLRSQEIVLKSVGPQLMQVPGVSGAAVLGDGQVAIILNPFALLARYPQAPAVKLVFPAPPAPRALTTRSAAGPGHPVAAPLPVVQPVGKKASTSQQDRAAPGAMALDVIPPEGSWESPLAQALSPESFTRVDLLPVDSPGIDDRPPAMPLASLPDTYPPPAQALTEFDIDSVEQGEPPPAGPLAIDDRLPAMPLASLPDTSPLPLPSPPPALAPVDIELAVQVVESLHTLPPPASPLPMQPLPTEAAALTVLDTPAPQLAQTTALSPPPDPSIFDPLIPLLELVAEPDSTPPPPRPQPPLLAAEPDTRAGARPVLDLLIDTSALDDVATEATGLAGIQARHQADLEAAAHDTAEQKRRATEALHHKEWELQLQQTQEAQTAQKRMADDKARAAALDRLSLNNIAQEKAAQIAREQAAQEQAARDAAELERRIQIQRTISSPPIPAVLPPTVNAVPPPEAESAPPAPTLLPPQHMLQPQAAAHVLPSDREKPVNITVMVVDDSLTVRRTTTRFLNREGYQVIAAKDGLDALEKLGEQHPDVVLLDVEMPRMDGFEFTRRVREQESTRTIPIIMITSRTAEKHRIYAQELGVNAFLGKPYQEDVLLQHIIALVGSS